MISIQELETKGINVKSFTSPWLFSNQVMHLDDTALNEQKIAIVRIKETNKYGIYHKNSLISVRFFSDYFQNYIQNNIITKEHFVEFFFNHLNRIVAIKKLYDFTSNEAYRVSHGDNDFFPSIAIDFYNTVYVIQISSIVGEFLLPFVIEALLKFTTLPLFERSTGQIRKLENLPERTRWIREPNISNNFQVDCNFANLSLKFFLNKAQKTGLFLDQRNNLKYLEKIIPHTKIKKSLDICSYAGAWSATAAKLGVENLTLIDQDVWALNLAKENILLNSSKDCLVTTLHGDLFEHLQKLNKENSKFDLIIADPPAFAKAKKHISEAARAYSRLAKLASRLLTDNGILVICSCSRHVSDELFLESIAKGFDNGNWLFLHKGEQSPCHTRLALPDSSDYLKCYFIQKRVL
ncbi:class I SAM-dependent rRNA methyltransferase [Pigmentibacter ruber]|uniref:class I SAM-dependent rRNA methyltransferase n=1 Tax=Pigmentibacter ruber TaxID=2683196 RepID=UPI00131BCDDF|nr:class I SAM-dependent methyltransferase [Pigmentibacter ruber]